MPYLITCSDKSCNETTYAANIVDLINNHRDDEGWFICSSCGQRGYIQKSYGLQEKGEVWEPYLQGIITIGDEGDTYQPFVFNVSYSPQGETDSLWFSYYKDLRKQGGQLKSGTGPGGPPIIHKDTFKELIKQLIHLGIITKEEIKSLLD